MPNSARSSARIKSQHERAEQEGEGRVLTPRSGPRCCATWAAMRRPSVNKCRQKSNHGILRVGFVAKECSAEQCCGTVPAWEHSHLAVWAVPVTPKAAGKGWCENRGLQGGHRCKTRVRKVTMPIAPAGFVSYHPWVDFASPAFHVFTINTDTESNHTRWIIPHCRGRELKIFRVWLTSSSGCHLKLRVALQRGLAVSFQRRLRYNPKSEHLHDRHPRLEGQIPSSLSHGCSGVDREHRLCFLWGLYLSPCRFPHLPPFNAMADTRLLGRMRSRTCSWAVTQKTLLKKARHEAFQKVAFFAASVFRWIGPILTVQTGELLSSLTSILESCFILHYFRNAK